MELKGINLINLTLNHWLKKHNFKARVRGADTDFFWYHDDTISYSFYFPQEAADNWSNLLEELNCNYVVDIFFSAFLHELGHSCTYSGFSEDEIDEYNETLDLMDMEPSSFAEGLEYTYTRLPVEIAATRWAVNYINSYPEHIAELVDSVGRALTLFYKLNNVVDTEPFDFN